MLYYTKEARDSARAKIAELIVKIGDIPGNVLTYGDACAVSRYLGMLSEEIMRQGLKAERDARLMHDAATIMPKEKVYAYAIQHVERLLGERRTEIVRATCQNNVSEIRRHAEMMTILSGEVDTIKAEMKLETGRRFEDYMRD